jgi:plastocyanin
MDRISPAQKFKIDKVKIGLAFVISVTLLSLPLAQADLVFAPAEKPQQDPKKGPVEVFPESRFGAPPVRVVTGMESHFASRAASDMDAQERGNGESDAVPAGSGEDSASRTPAGLDFSSGHLVRRQYPRNVAIETAPVVYSQPSVAATTSATIARRGVQEVALIASDLGFFPKTVFVSRDVPVRLFVTGASKNTLCIMMDSFQVRKQVRSQKIEEITFTPATPGKFRFYCPVNGMEGTMIVKELSTDVPGSAGGVRSVASVSNSE